MSKFIHIATRRNLFYILSLIIHYYLRKADLIIINTEYEFNDSLIFTLLMLWGEFLGGLAIFLYQNNFFIHTKRKKKGFLIFNKQEKMKRTDNIFKIILLIFFSASFDFVEFVIATFYIPKFSVVSPTSEYRFSGIIIIIGALICHFNMGVCLIVIIMLEIIYRGKGVSIGDFCFGYMLVIAYLIFVPFTDIIEKYLLEFNYANPYLILMAEAVFGFILISIYSAGDDPFKDIKIIYKEKSAGQFVLLIFLLFLYFSFSAGVNIYKILVNGLYSLWQKLYLYIF